MELTADFIRSLTYPEYYERGEEYYHRGRVVGLSEKDGLVTATVRGSDDYLITVDKNDLETHCNCPAYSRQSVCKHIIAVLLTILSGEIKPGELFGRKETKKNNTRTPRPPSPGNGLDTPLSQIKSSFKSLVRSQHRLHGRWDDYFDIQDEIFCQGQEIIAQIETNLDGMICCLDLAKWYDKELENIDDSNGVNQDLQYEFFRQAVVCADTIDTETVIAKLTPYLDHDSSFDFADLIIGAFFETPKANKIAEKLGEMCEAINRGVWQRARLPWCRYLKQIGDDRLEKTALKYFQENDEIALLLMDFYSERNDYQKAVEIGWPKRDRHRVSDLLVDILNRSGDKQTLATLLEERLLESFTKEELRKLKEIYLSENQPDKWDDFAKKLLKANREPESSIEILMFLKRYGEATEVILENNDWPFINKEDYARKLAVLDRPSAQKIYWHLVDSEVEKFKTSNHYLRFWAYIDSLSGLEVLPEINKYLLDIKNRFPTKKKLILEIEHRLG